MPRNTGTMPGAVKGKRVRVRLFNGYDTEEREPRGWPASESDWSISNPPHPFQIQFWKVIE